jgi:hypothetical protein
MIGNVEVRIIAKRLIADEGNNIIQSFEMEIKVR